MPNGYGWLHWDNPGRQEDGFFIDADNRILYWPSKRGPGYVLDEYTALAIYREKEVREHGEWMTVGLFFMLTLFLSGLGSEATKGGSFFYTISLIPVSVLILRQLVRWRKLSFMPFVSLEGFEKLELPRPKPDILVGNTRKAKILVWFLLPVGALILGLILGGIAGLKASDGVIEEALILALLVVVILYGPAHLIFERVRSIDPEQVRFYQWKHPTEHYEVQEENPTFFSDIKQQLVMEYRLLRPLWKTWLGILLMLYGLVFLFSSISISPG